MQRARAFVSHLTVDHSIRKTSLVIAAVNFERHDELRSAQRSPYVDGRWRPFSAAASSLSLVTLARQIEENASVGVCEIVGETRRLNVEYIGDAQLFASQKAQSRIDGRRVPIARNDDKIIGFEFRHEPRKRLNTDKQPQILASPPSSPPPYGNEVGEQRRRHENALNVAVEQCGRRRRRVGADEQRRRVQNAGERRRRVAIFWRQNAYK